MTVNKTQSCWELPSSPSHALTFTPSTSSGHPCYSGLVLASPLVPLTSPQALLQLQLLPAGHLLGIKGTRK